jgi:heptosyltransferase-2
VDLAGRLSIIESAAVIRRASLLVTNDSGLMHAADALDTPLAAVFGPTSRELGFYPLGGRSRVVEKKDLDCRPCTLHGDKKCFRGHHRCMEEVSAEEVVAAAREVL